MASCSSRAVTTRGPQSAAAARGRWARLTRSLTSLAVIAGTSTILACGGDTTPTRADEAPAADVAKEQAVLDGTPTPTPAGAKKGVATKGADGKLYHCSLAAMDRVGTAKDRVTRRDKILKGRKAAVRRLEKKYPGGKAPAAVVTQYKKLVARVNAQVRHANRAIGQYNRLLRTECSPD
jgi:hypothetical protein